MARHIHFHIHAPTVDSWEESKHPRREDGKFGQGTHERILAATRPISLEEARALVAGKTEKPGGTNPLQHLRESDSRELRYGNVPIDLFVANEDGERYDGTVNLERANDYAQRSAGTAPPVISTQGRRDPVLRIIDGGHRLSAARIRGDRGIPALVYVRRKPDA